MGSANKPSVFEFFMLILCVLSLGMLTIDLVHDLKPGTKQIIEIFDFGICMVFLYDFLRNIVIAKDRWGYMKWGWIDLLSSIPNIDLLRYGRIARVLRIVRLLRVFKSSRVIYKYLSENRAEASFLTIAVLSLLVLMLSSIFILHFESDSNSNISNASDAVWWSFVTVTTVGYGDFYPVTFGGRILASILMTMGIGLFGTFTGFVGSWFLNPASESEEKHTEKLFKELRELRQQVSSLQEKLEHTTIKKSSEKSGS